MKERTAQNRHEFAVHLIGNNEYGPIQDMLKIVAELLGIAAVLAGLVLSLGWSYAYAWFQSWKMPLSTLSIGVDHLFEYGRIVIVANVWLIVPAIILLCVLYFLSKKHLVLPANFLPLVLVAGMIVCWLSAHWMGKHAATADFEKMAEGDFQLLPMVAIVLKPGTEIPSGFARDIALERPCYRMIFISDDDIWLARTRDYNRDPLVAMVPRDQVALLQLHPTRGNCPVEASQKLS